MADALTGPMESLSSWWKAAALGTMAAGFAVLILLTVKAYQKRRRFRINSSIPLEPWSSQPMTSLPASRSS